MVVELRTQTWDTVLSPDALELIGGKYTKKENVVICNGKVA